MYYQLFDTLLRFLNSRKITSRFQLNKIKLWMVKKILRSTMLNLFYWFVYRCLVGNLFNSFQKSFIILHIAILRGFSFVKLEWSETKANKWFFLNCWAFSFFFLFVFHPFWQSSFKALCFSYLVYKNFVNVLRWAIFKISYICLITYYVLFIFIKSKFQFTIQ